MKFKCVIIILFTINFKFKIFLVVNCQSSNLSNVESVDQVMAESFSYEMTIQALKQQIFDSEKNLKAQDQVIQLQKQVFLFQLINNLIF